MAITFPFEYDKAKAALLYLASKRLPEFTKYKAIKLVFLADREHLLRFARPITGDTYAALPFGPVPNRILALLGSMEAILSEETADVARDPLALDLAKCFSIEEGRYPTYRANEAADLERLSESDRMVLDQVASEYGTRSFDEIYNLTHALKAYSNAWHDDSVRKRFPMSFEDFFLDRPEMSVILDEITEDQRIRQAHPNYRYA